MNVLVMDLKGKLLEHQVSECSSLLRIQNNIAFNLQKKGHLVRSSYLECFLFVNRNFLKKSQGFQFKFKNIFKYIITFQHIQWHFCVYVFWKKINLFVSLLDKRRQLPLNTICLNLFYRGILKRKISECDGTYVSSKFFNYHVTLES